MILLAAFAAAAAGCGGADSPATVVPTGPTAPSTSSPTTPPTTSPTPPPTTAQAGSAALQWDAVSTSDLGGYRVYFGTAPGTYSQARGQGLAAGSNPSFTVTNLQSGVTYFFAVTSYDLSGNESPYSSEVSKRIN